MATPSLAMIPSGYKASKVYSVLPESGVGDFDFTRATTATRINSSGLIETVATNVPRLEYPLIDGVVNGCPSLILEPQRTNAITYSEDFSQSAWIKTSGATITSSYGISPSGLQNSTRLQLSTLNEQIYISVGTHSGNTEVASLYIKGVSGETVQFGVGSNIGQGDVITLNGNWQRIYQESTSGTVLIIGNKDATATDFEIWGVQLEEGSYATSYILTNGSTVTRNAEVCNGAGDSATFNDSEGVLMTEISALVDDQARRQISVSDGTVDNVVRIHYNNDGSNRIRFQIRSNNAIEVSAAFSVNNIKEFHKVLISYKLNDVKFFIDGFKVGTDTSASMPIGLDVLNFDQGNGLQDFYGKTKQVQYYNSPLTDSELEQLTSWTSFSDMANGQQYSII